MSPYSLKEMEILRYARKYIDQMWASKVVAIITGCDFKDADLELDKIFGGDQ